LEQHVRDHEQVRLRLRGTEIRWRCRELSEKGHVYACLRRYFEDAAPEQRRELCLQMFGETRTQQETDRMMLSWQQLQTLADSPWVTIGAHTRTHPVLKALPDHLALQEIADSKATLEEKLQRPVEHFAYPYGGPEHVSKRDVEFARICGFKTAATTSVGNVFAQHGSHPHVLPRLYSPQGTLHEMRLQLSGVGAALRLRGRRFATIS
jgi:hypothetical protein